MMRQNITTVEHMEEATYLMVERKHDLLLPTGPYFPQFYHLPVV
jgi:hypothetical protein